MIGISYVGGREYLDRALASLGRWQLDTVVVDNASVPLDSVLSAVTYRPPVPMTHTQTHVDFQRQAIRRGLPFYLVMHADAEASELVVEALVMRAQDDVSARKKIAVWYTNYDALAAYSTAAARDVGEWDWQLFPSYYSDPDYYYRCKLAGWELVDTGLPVKHVGSHIINKVDRWRKLYTRLRMDSWTALYLEKWGGHPGHEQFKHPFNINPAIGPYPEG